MTEKSERWEQRQVIQWARQYPWGRLLFHVPNEGHHHDTDMGVRSGVPDLVLPVPMGRFHGLFIEMKREDGGQLSHNQKLWLHWLRAMGYRAECCHGWEAARGVLVDYMGVTDDDPVR